MPPRERAYSLSLADGTVWTFLAAEDQAFNFWIDEFAHILKLNPAVFSGRPARKKSAAFRGLVRFVPLVKNRVPEGPDESWSSYSQGSAYRVWVSPAANEAVLEIEQAFIDHPEIRYIYMSAALRIVFRHSLLSGSGCSFHAASAAFKGSGIIITASGQTGKSTCYNRFPAPWAPLSDDTALAVKTASGHFAVHPMPTWSDYLRAKKRSTFETGTAFPLKGLFFLKRGDRDDVERVSPAIAAGMLQRLSREAWSSFLGRLQKDEKKRLDQALFDACCAVANTTPAYLLRATLHGEFWREIEKVL
jgi:SynChlorMet cassette protein ScmC